MAGLRRISYLWKEPELLETTRRGFLHSHTNQSKETLRFLATWEINTRCCAPFWPGVRGNPVNGHQLPVN